MSQLFEESHKELLNLVKWVSRPLMYIPEGAIDNEMLAKIEPGMIVRGYVEAGKAIEVVYSLPKDDASLILKTFCASHARLK